jgi:hypothetical protein
LEIFKVPPALPEKSVNGETVDSLALSVALELGLAGDVVRARVVSIIK